MPSDCPPLGQVDPDAPDAANLWRVHWFNGPDRKIAGRCSRAHGAAA